MWRTSASWSFQWQQAEPAFASGIVSERTVKAIGSNHLTAVTGEPRRVVVVSLVVDHRTTNNRPFVSCVVCALAILDGHMVTTHHPLCQANSVQTAG